MLYVDVKQVLGVLALASSVACAQAGDSEDDLPNGDGGAASTASGTSSSGSGNGSTSTGSAGGGGQGGGGEGGSGGEFPMLPPAPGNGFAYVGMSTADDLGVADLATNDVVAASVSLLPNGNYPYDATMRPDASEVWTVGASGDGVAVLDAATNTVTQNIPLGASGAYPVDVLFSVDGSEAYVSARDGAAIVIIETATYAVVGDIALPAGMDGGKMTLDPCTGRIYTVDWYDNAVIEIDPATGMVTATAVGDSLWDLVIDPSGTTLYVTDRGMDQVHLIDVASLAMVASVAVGDDPWGIDITPDGATVVVASEDAGSLTFIDTATQTPTTIDLAGAEPRDVDIADDGLLAYVPTGDQPGDDGLLVIDMVGQSSTGMIALGAAANPNVVAVAPEHVHCNAP